MGRPTGRRNADHAQARQRLAEAVADRLVVGLGDASLSELASAAQVSTPTVRHYFQDRDGAVLAGLGVLGARGAPHTARLALPSDVDLTTSLTDALREIVMGWRHFGVGRVIQTSLRLGLADDGAGRATVDHILEPLVDAMERRLLAHQRQGTFDVDASDDDRRVASLAVLSPVLIALLHQDGLDGATCRPLDVDAFVVAHVRRFVRAWGTPSDRQRTDQQRDQHSADDAGPDSLRR